jgi:inner membrane protein
MTMLWWHWLVLGLLLAGLELATPGGFYLLFFGVGALLVGVLDMLGLSGPPWVQWLLFSIASVGALLLFRDPLLRYMREHSRTQAPVDALTDETATTLEDIAPGEIGRAELRGTAWSARNVGQTMLMKGQRCAVQRVDGLTLNVQPEGAR